MATKLVISAKCSDRCSCQVIDSEGKLLAESDSYVPKGIGIGEEYGDYVDLEIDIKTGQILNWKPLTDAQVVKAVKEA